MSAATFPGTGFSPAAALYREFLESIPHLKLDEPELLSLPVPPGGELLWQSRWFAGDFGRDFVTVDGEPVHILDFGWWNHGAGPDFSDCVVDIGGTVSRGSIELDPCLRDWETHGHGTNPAYRNTVLHLCLQRPAEERFFTRTSEHRAVPQVWLDASALEATSEERSAPAHPGLCVEHLCALPETRVMQILEQAARYRLECKSRRWLRVADIHGYDQALFHGIAEALGYSRNKLPMSVLAQRLPLRFLQKRPNEVEALLFGLAGFLDGRAAKHPDEATAIWLQMLWQTWWKYRAELASGPATRPVQWTLSGTRPVNHPQRRIAALGQIAARWKTIRRLLDPAAFHEATFTAALVQLDHPYWSHHYTLSAKPSSTKLALLGESRVQDLLANVIYPLLIPQREELWDHYLKMSAPMDNQKTAIAGLRLFGTAARARKFSAKLWQQQALLQIYADFCLASPTGCPGCPFPAQIAKPLAPA